MTTETEEAENSEQPKRDERGRFAKGISGNPNGRPHKAPELPWSLAQSIAEAFDEEVPVSGSRGESTMKLRDLAVKAAVRGLPKARTKELFDILERLERIGALQPLPVEQEPVFTEEDRRILAEAEKFIAENVCCCCDLPIRESSPSRSNFQDRLD